MESLEDLSAQVHAPKTTKNKNMYLILGMIYFIIFCNMSLFVFYPFNPVETMLRMKCFWKNE